MSDVVATKKLGLGLCLVAATESVGNHFRTVVFRVQHGVAHFLFGRYAPVTIARREARLTDDVKELSMYNLLRAVLRLTTEPLPALASIVFYRTESSLPVHNSVHR